MSIKKMIAIVAGIALCVGAAAEKTPIENLYRYRLSNGLEVFVAEEHSEPTVYINIAVRAGAVAQTAETAGLFHLYEHMMFNGNALYATSHQMELEMKKLGVIEDNGYTSTDEVNYFFTIPSDKVEEGLAFWNAAIRSPLLNEAELENEKKVVLAEIEGDAADKKFWAQSFVQSALYPKAPFKQDAGGSFDVVRNATVEQLREMQREYYIPSNAALFIAGDVDVNEVMPLVRDIYGSWSNNGAQPKENLVSQPKNPLEKTTVAIYPTPAVSDNFTSVEVIFRAPDCDFDFDEVVVADYLSYILGFSDMPYTKTFEKDTRLRFFNDEDRVSSGLYVARQSSEFGFSTNLKNADEHIIDDALYFKDKIVDEILPKIADTKKYYTAAFSNRIVDEASYDYVPTKKASKAIIDVIEQFWILGIADEYFSYDEKLFDVRQWQMQDLVEKYFTQAEPLVLIAMSPEKFKELESPLRQSDAVIIEDDSFVWWKNELVSPKPVVTTKEGIYVPNGRYNGKSVTLTLGEIKTAALKNGIPVYLVPHKEDSEDADCSVELVLRGGLQHIAKGEEGLENCLFFLMANNSQKYSVKKRNEWLSKYDAAIDFYSEDYFSSLYLLSGNAPDFFKCLDMFADGILNPRFDEKLLAMAKDSTAQNITSSLSDPDYYVSQESRKELFKNIPYASHTGFISTDFDFVTAESLGALYERIMNASDMYIIASGDVDLEKLVQKLNKSIGKLAAYESSFVPFSPYTIEEGAPKVFAHENAAGTGIAYSFRPVPSRDSEDYAPLRIASDIYSSVLYSVVREKHGACYSPSAYNSKFYASECIFKISDFAHFASYLAEAKSEMLSGIYIDELLEGVKIAVVRDLESGWSTVRGKASLIARDTVYSNNPRWSEDFAKKINAVTADDVRRVFQKYWVDAPCRWFAVTGADEVQKIRFE